MERNMELNIETNTGILQIDNARIIFRNFSGRGDKYNREGDRNFVLVIPDQEIADRLIADKNEYGVGWNVKIKAPRKEGDEPFMFMTVKVKFNDRGPNVYLVSGESRIKLSEETISMLDDIDIQSVDLDIRPYDGEGTYGPFRSAYLQCMEVIQNVDRFEARHSDNIG